MKILFFLTFILYTVQTFAEQKDKTKTPTVTAKQPAKTPEAPCAESAEEVLKKLEEKKKAEAKQGLGLSLQGSGSSGCTIK
jgi:hypothetical protein